MRVDVDAIRHHEDAVLVVVMTSAAQARRVVPLGCVLLWRCKGRLG